MTISERDPDQRPARIAGPADLVQAVPYLLGFQPHESMVLVCLDHGAYVVSARLDLCDVDGSEQTAEALLEHTLEVAARSGAQQFVAVVFTEVPGLAELPAANVIERLRCVVERHGWELRDALLVRSGRYWSYLCAEDCCPPDGTALPAAPCEFVLDATVRGTVVLPDRAAAAGVLDPCPDEVRARLEGALADAENSAMEALLASRSAGARHSRSERRAVLAAVRASHSPGWTPPPDAELARYAVALTSLETRDAVWYEIEEGHVDGRPLMSELVRRAPAPYDAAPAFLFGWACWRAGNTLLARVAAERALAGDPDCRAAEMLVSAVDLQLDPRRVPAIRRG